MSKNRSTFEKDEKKSIIIALVVSAVVVLAVVLAVLAVRKNSMHTITVDQSGASSESESESGSESMTSFVATNQEELIEALGNENCTEIYYATEETTTIIIPSGDYSGIRFTIDAPYTEVTNYGVFSTITINRIASNTWTESASGNSFVIDSAACHLIVPSGISVGSIENMQSNSTLAIENSGSIALLALEASNSISSIEINGTLSQLIVYSQTNLSVSGSSNAVVPLEISYGADGSVVSSTVPLGINTYSSVNFEACEGAEDSTLTVLSRTAVVDYTNNSTTDATVTTYMGEIETVAAGESKHFETEEEKEPSSSNASANSGSNSSSASGAGHSSSGSSASSGSSSSGSSTVGNGTSSSSSSTGSSQNSTGNGTTGILVQNANTYTKEQVDEMVKKAVSDAITANNKNMITKEQADKLVEQKTQKLEEEIVTKDKLIETIQNAITEVAIDEMIKTEVKKEVSNTIVSFITPEPVYAGDSEAAALVEDLPLPKTIIGVTAMNVQIPVEVTRWINKDEYGSEAQMGVYRFVAYVDETKYTVMTDRLPTVKVFVGNEEAGITKVYSNNNYKDLLAVTEYMPLSEDIRPSEVEAYYLMTNITEEKLLDVSLHCYYFKEGKYIASNVQHQQGRSIAPGRSNYMTRVMPLMDYDMAFVEFEIVEDAFEAVSMITSEPEEGKIAIWYDTEGIGIIKIDNQTEEAVRASEITVYMLALDENRRICGTEMFMTSQNGIPSINEMKPTGEYIMKNTASAYKVMVSGGYLMDETQEGE